MSASIAFDLGSAALALVFGTAAAAKMRGRRAFAEYLTVAVGKAARPAATAIVGLEALLAAGLLIPDTRRLAGVGVCAFLLGGSCFIGWRLMVADDTDCRCWGERRALARPAQNGREIIKPAWYGLRNGGLLFATWLVWAGSGGREEDQNRLIGVLAFAACPAVVALGLVAAIVARRWLLNLPEHPLKMELAPQLAPLVALSWYLGSGRRLHPTGVGGRKGVQGREAASPPLQERNGRLGGYPLRF